MKGRKKKQESRAAEFRERLMVWKQTPEPLRPSLRELARELNTSHQLLEHYLDGLENWICDERRRKAKEESEDIRARAKAQSREMTGREFVRAMVHPALLGKLADIRRNALLGPLHPTQFRLLKILAKQGFQEAEEVLQSCRHAGLKKRKRFAAIVKDTPRQENEPSIGWVRRIWNECDKYDTHCPSVITEEVLEQYSRNDAKTRTENLPQIFSQNAKSFKSGNGDTGNSAKAEGRRTHAIV